MRHTLKISILILLVASTAFAQAAEPTAPPLVAPPPEPASCASNADCGPGQECVETQPLGDWSKRSCQAPRAAGEPARLPKTKWNEPERFLLRDDDVPAGFHILSEPRMGLLGGGIGALGGGYLVTALTGFAGGQAWGAIPLVGPIFLAQAWWATGSFASLVNVFVVLLAAVEVAAQVAGAVMLTVALAAPKRWLERDAQKPTISFVPGAGSTPLGGSLVGRF